MEDNTLLEQMLINMMQPIASFVETIVPPIARCMGNFKRRLLYMRKHGTRQEKRLAWMVLHPPQRKKISSKRRMQGC